MNVLTQQFQNHSKNPRNSQLTQQVQQFAETNPLAQRVKSLGSPKAAYDYLMNSNTIIKGPNGQQMNIRDFCNQIGIDPTKL